MPRTLLLFLLACLLPLSSFGSAAQPSTPNWRGKIAFNSVRDDNMDIYLINPDGSDLTRLTFAPAEDFTPALSPDGSRIAFTSERDGDQEVYVLDAATLTPVNVTNHDEANDYYPQWFPNGTHLLFESIWGPVSILSIDTDGSDLIRLTAPLRDGYSPTLAPDGRIAFVGTINRSDQDIYVMNADGSNLTKLTETEIREVIPAWSPDGRYITFVSQYLEENTTKISVMESDGSNRIDLTDNGNSSTNISWSPDSQHIAFSVRRNGNRDIYVMAIDGTAEIKLTHHSGDDNAPLWSPDGRQIAFNSDRDGNWEIYIMNADGSEQTNLTHYPGEDYLAAWFW